MSSDNDAQIAYWNGPAGERWALLQDRIGAMLDPFGAATREALAPQAGARVLDIGCGAGADALALAGAVGPGGAVLGVDVSRPLLEVARGRAAGLANLQFEEADAGACAWGARRFDLFYSRFGVMFFADPLGAFTHLRAAAAPGARMAFACWRSLGENPWALVPLGAVMSVLPTPPAPPTDPFAPDPFAPGPFAFADPARVMTILTQAGWRDAALQPFEAPVRFGVALDDAVDLAMRIGPGAALLADADAATRAAARAAVETALAPHLGAGAPGLKGSIWIVTARA